MAPRLVWEGRNIRRHRRHGARHGENLHRVRAACDAELPRQLVGWGGAATVDHGGAGDGNPCGEQYEARVEPGTAETGQIDRTQRGDRILGATIVGEHAGDLIAEFVTAMRHGLGMNKILGTIHIYPTLAEANKYAAGNWKKAHAPQGVLRGLERFHAWMRG